VAEMFKINASTLRFWEKEFPALKPDTNLKGNRKYTKKDIELIKQIHYYSVEKGMTLKGVKNQLIKNRSKKYESVSLIDELLSVRASLEEIRKELNNFKSE
jgi:DNA-binding transcriptional MerR regulator